MGLEELCHTLVLLYAARGGEVDYEKTLRWKISFDGTDCGDKSLLAFFLVPLDLGVPGQPSEQSSKTVQLMGLGWGSESTASLRGFIPSRFGGVY